MTNHEVAPRNRWARWAIAAAVVLFLVYPAVRWWFGRDRVETTVTANDGVAAGSDEVGALLDESMRHAEDQSFEACRDAALKAATLDPGSARAFSNAGFCAAMLGNWASAIELTEEALRLDPSLQIAKNNLAWMREAQDDAGESSDR